MPEIITILWIVICAFLVFLMQAGFLALETGATRAKNNIDVAMKNIVDFTLSAFMYWAVGFPIMFGIAYLGGLSFFPTLSQNPNLLLLFLFQVMFCGTTVTIVSGAIAERTHFWAYLVVSILLASLVYPLFGQWVWSSSSDGDLMGWLGQLGFFDFAGSTVVHSVGGWAALAIIIIVGARHGRFDENGNVVDIPKSNLPFMILGVLLLWFGWFGFNGGSSFAFDDRTLIILFNTMMGGSVGGLTGLIFSMIRHEHVDIETVLNGVLAGLVAITAGANVFNEFAILLTASIGVLVFLAVSKLLEELRLDDVVGAIPVHLGAGVWGTFAVGLFGNLELMGSDLSRINQIGVQSFGIVICGIWSFGIIYVVMRIVNQFYPLRVSLEDEELGLNISEHNARTDLLDLLDTMQEQSVSRDFSTRVAVEPFTQIGRIASYYNLVMNSLEEVQGNLTISNRTLEDRLEDIRTANNKLSAANEQIKGFTNILSHDLRSPIASVQALIDEIQYQLDHMEINLSDVPESSSELDDFFKDLMPETLKLLNASIAQMDTMTKQILVIAKEDQRTHQIDQINMQDLVQQIIDSQMGIIRKNQIDVTIQDMPTIKSDAIAIQQIFNNLISNAFKYLEADRQGKVVISGENKTNSIIYQVGDNGIGIPESRYDRVFELFRRVRKHKNIEGSGFGLYYIRGIVNQLEGKIWFESEEGKGTTFYVELPTGSNSNGSYQEEITWGTN